MCAPGGLPARCVYVQGRGAPRDGGAQPAGARERPEARRERRHLLCRGGLRRGRGAARRLEVLHKVLIAGVSTPEASLRQIVFAELHRGTASLLVLSRAFQ